MTNTLRRGPVNAVFSEKRSNIRSAQAGSTSCNASPYQIEECA
jgi:hypothetical protein